MLQSIRDLSKSWVVKGLMALLVASFAIWGVGDMFRTHPGQRVVASVGDKEFTVQDLDFRFKITLPQIRQQFGADLTLDQAKQLGMLDQSLQVMMEESSFEQEAARLGLDLNPVVVFQEIAQNPRLHDADGNFDQNTWNQLLQKSGFSESFFINERRKELTRNIPVRAVLANVTAPKIMIDNLYQAQGAKRIFEILTLRNSSETDIAAPSDEDLQAYYEAHEDKYAAPEYRGITIARLLAEDIEKDIDVSDEELKQAYETRKSEFSVPETRDLLQVVFQDQEKAATFHDKAAQTSFTKAAKELRLTAVPMDGVDDKSILPTLYTSVFSLGENEVTPPLKTDLGWHVILIKKIHEGGNQAFADIKDGLRKTLQQERTGDMIARQINQLDDFLAGGGEIEDIAGELKLHLSRYAALDFVGNDKKGHQVKDIPYKEDVLQMAYELNEGETSQVLDDRQGNYFVVRTDSLEPSHTKDFDVVKAQVKADLRAEKQAEAAIVHAQKIAKEVQEGKKLTAYASLPGVKIRMSKPISQLEDTDEDLPAKLVKKILKMNKDEVITAQDDNHQLVLKLVDIVPVDPTKPEGSRFKVIDTLASQLRLDFLEHYARVLRERFPWKVDSEVLESMKN